MNDKAISLLEQYGLEIKRTWKGRGAYLCEASEGLYIFKEYTGPEKKLAFLNECLTKLKELGEEGVEQLVPNKEGALMTLDGYKTPYVLKTYFAGTEMNYQDIGECEQVMRRLATLHGYMERLDLPKESMALQNATPIIVEYERHNKELKRVRHFLREKGNKTEFELYLLQHFDYFYEQALQVVEELTYYEDIHKGSGDHILCHGDFQYHNIITQKDTYGIINFEKCLWDNGVRDLCLFLRKLLEKTNWSIPVGERLLLAYTTGRSLTWYDQIQIHYRLAYPIKFWKIVNYYYNHGKAWIPSKNREKIELLQEQEPQKQLFLKATIGTLG